MMHNYSENWRHLKSILVGHATRDSRAKSYSLTDHNHAKALSIFLANATLATPRMDRMTVEAVLSGRQSWPNTLGKSQFDGAGPPLSMLEEYGLVAFYAGWCTVHCQTVRDLDNVDPSLIPLIEAVQHLKHILYGREGFIQPHYICPADKLDGLLAKHFGGFSATELLPELVSEGGRLKLPPGNENFDALVSTYLWQKLRETLEPGEAFQFWILCLRVNCDWTMPVLVDYLEQQEIAEFNDQVLEYLDQDLALRLDMNFLRKQLLSEDRFASIVTPVQSQLSITIEADGGSSSKYKDSELEKPTLVTLSSAYISTTINPSSDLQFVRQWERTRHWGEPAQFYTPLLASAIDASIVKRALSLVAPNQVIVHDRSAVCGWARLDQIIYLHITFPSNGSRGALLLRLCQAVDDLLGTTYLDHYRSEQRRVRNLDNGLAMVCSILSSHRVAAVVIDESPAFVGAARIVSSISRITGHPDFADLDVVGEENAPVGPGHQATAGPDGKPFVPAEVPDVIRQTLANDRRRDTLARNKALKAQLLLATLPMEDERMEGVKEAHIQSARDAIARQSSK